MNISLLPSALYSLHIAMLFDCLTSGLLVSVLQNSETPSAECYCILSHTSNVSVEELEISRSVPSNGSSLPRPLPLAGLSVSLYQALVALLGRLLPPEIARPGSRFILGLCGRLPASLRCSLNRPLFIGLFRDSSFPAFGEVW